MSTNDITNINNIGLFFIVIMGILTIILPRRFAFMPLIISTCYMTLGQQLLVETLNFTIMRIMILFGWIRLFVRREYFSIKLNTIDKLIIWWVVVSVVIYTLSWQTSEAIINQLGFVYNTIGLYFLFRFFIRDLDDINRAIKVIAVIVVPLAILMLIESTTGRNLFSVFGGVREFSTFREGKFRCQGPFAHPILAGTFGATCVPLFLALWFRGRSGKLLGIIGSAAATIITIISTSSGPVMSYLAGIVGLMMWPFRKRMRVIRWGILSAVIALHIIMKAPVWALIGRLSNITGGTGWHRVELINAAIDHFDEWWLLGTKYTAHWLPDFLPIDPNSADITNEFIKEGVNGGVLKMTLFIIITALCFRAVGRAVQVMEGYPFSKRILVWSLGATLFAHVTAFISVSYFDQMIVLWYLLLAMISAISNFSKTFKAVGADT
jgi:hypothetical protein